MVVSIPLADLARLPEDGLIGGLQATENLPGCKNWRAARWRVLCGRSFMKPFTKNRPNSNIHWTCAIRWCF